jgi:hypothetical protein
MMIYIKLAKHEFHYFVVSSQKENLMLRVFPSGQPYRLLTGPDLVQLPADDKNFSYIYSVFRERRERSPPLPKIVLPS